MTYVTGKYLQSCKNILAEIKYIVNHQLHVKYKQRVQRNILCQVLQMCLYLLKGVPLVASYICIVKKRKLTAHYLRG